MAVAVVVVAVMVVVVRTVDSHIRNQRRKLAQASPGQDPIQTLYGVGYKLEL